MEHPITPPPELVSKWCYEDGEEIKSSPRWFFSVCAKAAQWGADQELEACCEYLVRCAQWEPWEPEDVAELRAARRPKPPSLKEQALTALTRYTTGETILTNESVDTIRRALESIHD